MLSEVLNFVSVMKLAATAFGMRSLAICRSLPQGQMETQLYIAFFNLVTQHCLYNVRYFRISIGR